MRPFLRVIPCLALAGASRAGGLSGPWARSGLGESPARAERAFTPPAAAKPQERERAELAARE